MNKRKQKRLLKPHIYKTLLAISIFMLYTGMFALAAGHKTLGIFSIIVTMVIMIIATNEEHNKQQVTYKESKH